jgi:hypothetical protein
MKVYCVFESGWEENTLVCVFDSEDKAINYMENSVKEQLGLDGFKECKWQDNYFYEFSYQEMEVK